MVKISCAKRGPADAARPTTQVPSSRVRPAISALILSAETPVVFETSCKKGSIRFGQVAGFPNGCTTEP